MGTEYSTPSTKTFTTKTANARASSHRPDSMLDGVIGSVTSMLYST